MVDEDTERLDWGNDDDEQQAPPESSYAYSPRQSAYTGAVEDAEDAEDAVSLGGDDEDEREYYANHTAEQVSAAGIPPFSSKPPSSSSYGGRRDSQRQTAANLSRTPSRAQNSPSPTRDSHPPNSQGKLPPLPLVHGLPPKPTLVPPLFEQPAETGIRASAMANRRRANGKGAVGEGDDPLPPDWEIRYPRTGGKDAYYYNTKTDESTWTRPEVLTSGRSSPAKNGGRYSPEIMDNDYSERTSRSQQPRISRRDTVSRRPSPPPNQDLSYADRHYRPGEASVPAPTTNPDDRRGERGVTGPGYYPEAAYAQGRSPSPQPVSDGKRRTRSLSPQWDRRARRDLSPIPSQGRAMRRDGRGEYSQGSQAGGSDSGWGRSQDHPDGMHSVTRSPPARRNRHKDDIEPPTRRKDSIEYSNRRRDDVEPRIRRKDDIEPPIEPRTRRKDEVEPRIRRKDDIEPPLRRKDHLQPSLPPRDPSSRYADEWAAPSTRPRSPPPPLHEPSPRMAYHAPPSSSTRDAPRYERSRSPPPPPPPGRYRDNFSNDGLPQRRGRDADGVEHGLDSKRRRLNDDLSSRHGPNEPPSPATSLPIKTLFLKSYPPGELEREIQNRKRAPLPPQHEQWMTSSQVPPPAPGFAPPSNDSQAGESLSFAETIKFLGFNPVNETSPDGRPLNDHLIRLFDRDPNNRFFARPKRPSNAMDVDGSRPPRNDNSGRSSMGGMYSDRMSTAPAPEAAPRAPRAMVPRDSGTYSSVPPSLSPTSPYGVRASVAPVVEPAGPPSGRGGRLRPDRGPPMGNRWWETNGSDRQGGFAGPSPIDRPMDLLPPPPKRTNDMSRNLPERPPPLASDVPQRGMGRGSTPRMTGTNSIPIGPRTAGHEGVPPLDSQPFRQGNSDRDSYRPPQNADRISEPADTYPKRSTRYPRDETIPEQRPRSDRVDRRPSVTTVDTSRRGVVDSPVDERAPARQSRFGPPMTPMEVDAPRIWQTREEARGQGPRSNEDIVAREPRDIPDRVPRDERPVWRHPSPPRDGPGKGPNQFQERPRRSFPPPQPAPRAPPDVPPRPSRALTPPRLADRRDEEPLLPERPAATKVHPDRAHLFDPNAKPSTSKPVRIRRPAKSPDRSYTERIPEDIRPPRNLPPKPDDARMSMGTGPSAGMGPPPRERERSPPPPVQNGNSYRPHVKRGTSLLERLNVHEHEEVPASSSLRDRVDVAEGSSGRSDSTMMMDVDSGGGFGDDNGKGRGAGMQRRRGPTKQRRGGRRGGL